ncbi:hypothetical protein [Acidovorax sp. Leaf78]|uniref:hypothetical protein n=1 Tax=unclassified Acidovorax TaxID=2684926 RepID=UPI000700DA79|nr:hypothetical protein [Acidovorax sp. Leaf78]KQO27112.1 hypothetical protein ASF16_19040 [Acidovorax sp. Leaf78]
MNTAPPTQPPSHQPRWLYQAQDVRGQPTEGFVHAATAEEALQAIAAQQPPLSQVQLHTSSLHARAMTEMLDDVMGPLDVKALRQLARDQIENLESPGVWTTLRQLLRNNRGWLLACAALIAVAVWFDWSSWVVGGLVAALLVPFALFAYMHRFQRMYQNVLHAHATGDQARLRSLAEQLASAAQRHKFLVQPGWDAAVRVAWFEARTEGAEAAILRLRIHPLRPADDADFLARTYTLPLATGDHPGFIARLRELLAQRPGEPTLQMDLALGEARAGHTEEATRLLDALKPELLPPHGQAFIDWVRGMVALRDPALAGDAARHLGSACEQFLGLVRKAPGAWPSLAVCTCDYALALAWTGHARQAREAFAGVQPVARHHAEPERLAMLERELRKAA